MKVACILFCLVIVAPCVLGLTLQVEPKSKECFSELYPRHRNLNFNWQVIRGGLLDINVQIRYDGPEQRPFDQPEMLFEKLYFEKDHAPGSVSFYFFFFFFFFCSLIILVCIYFDQSFSLILF